MNSLIKSTTMRAILALLFFGTALLTAGTAFAKDGKKSEDNRYAENKGFYAYGGLAIAKTNYDVSGLDANVGIAFGGGYRFMDFLAADMDIYWAGRDQGPFKTRSFGLTLNAKFYPIGLISPTTLDWLQPYVVAGMGGGQGKITDAGAFDQKQGTYIFRLGAGTEVFIVGGLAAYMDLSLHATPGLKVTGASRGGATGVIQFGAVYHF